MKSCCQFSCNAASVFSFTFTSPTNYYCSRCHLVFIIV